MRWTLEPLRHACTSQSPYIRPSLWDDPIDLSQVLGSGLPSSSSTPVLEMVNTGKFLQQKRTNFKKWMQSSSGKDCGAQFAPSSTIWIFLKPMSPQKDKPPLVQLTQWMCFLKWYLAFCTSLLLLTNCILDAHISSFTSLQLSGETSWDFTTRSFFSTILLRKQNILPP